MYNMLFSGGVLGSVLVSDHRLKPVLQQTTNNSAIIEGYNVLLVGDFNVRMILVNPGPSAYKEHFVILSQFNMSSGQWRCQVFSSL